MSPKIDPSLSAIAPEPLHSTGALCPECEHLNPIDLKVCDNCSAELWTLCPDCGASNRRVDPLCRGCSRRLLKGTSRRDENDDKWSMKVWLAFLIAGGILFSLAVLHFLTNFSLPRLW